MKLFKRSVRKLTGGESGASMAEYILIITMISVAMIVVVGFFGDTIKSKLFESGEDIENLDSRPASYGDRSSSSGARSGSTADSEGLQGNGSKNVSGWESMPGSASGGVDVSSGKGSRRPRPERPGKNRGTDSKAAEGPAGSAGGISSGDVHMLYGDERAYEQEVSRYKWNLFVRYLLIGLSGGIIIALSIVSYMRIKAMISQIKQQE